MWLTQQQIADLFGVKQPAISKHLNNIFKDGELIKKSVHSILEYTAAGKNIIYTGGVGKGMQRLMDEHDHLFPESHVDIRKWRKESHDRWLIIDDQLYHCGHSLDANGGHKISAITLMGIAPEVILAEME